MLVERVVRTPGLKCVAIAFTLGAPKASAIDLGLLRGFVARDAFLTCLRLIRSPITPPYCKNKCKSGIP
jgi:hypothetical protein